METPKPDEVIFQTKSKIGVVLSMFGYLAAIGIFLFVEMLSWDGEIPVAGYIPFVMATVGLLVGIPKLQAGLAKSILVNKTMVHIQTFGPDFDLARDEIVQVHLVQRFYGWLANHANLSIRMKDGREISLFYVMDAVALRRLIDPDRFPAARREADNAG